MVKNTSRCAFGAAAARVKPTSNRDVLLFVRSDGLAGSDSEVWGVPRATGARLPLHLFPHHHRASGVPGRAAV